MPLRDETWKIMETFSALLALCAGNSSVSGEFPAQRPVTRSFDVFFDPRLNKRLSKQLYCWCFRTPSHPLWRPRNEQESVIRLSYPYTSIWFIATKCGRKMTNTRWFQMNILTKCFCHYCDVIMDAMTSQITSLTIIYSIVHSGADKKNIRKLRVHGLCAVTGDFPTGMAQ